jgi:AraC family transcriptional regulator
MKLPLRIEYTKVGTHVNMSVLDNKTHELWKGFISKYNKLLSTPRQNLYSVQLYTQENSFENFDPSVRFEKWATIEKESLKSVPNDMEFLSIPEGQYAVFTFQGSDQNARNAFHYIFGDWLPKSEYTLDDRPHFEVLGKKYIRASEDSEEEIWIPIKNKA